MRAVILEVDERMLAERRRLGLDRQDEMWEGVLHLVPPPFTGHGRMQAALIFQFASVVDQVGLVVGVETGVYAADDDYRVPDVVVYPPSAASERGIEGAPLLVVEIRSPGDESDAKVPWYLGRGAGSVVVVDRDTFSVDVFTADGPVEPGADGLTAVPGLGVRLGPAVDGGALLVETDTGVHRITA